MFDPTNYLSFNPHLVPSLLKSNQIQILDTRGVTLFNHALHSVKVNNEEDKFINIDSVKLVTNWIPNKAPLVIVKNESGKATLLIDLLSAKLSASSSLGHVYEVKIKAELKEFGRSLGVHEIAVLHCKKDSFPVEEALEVQSNLKIKKGKFSLRVVCIDKALALVFIRRVYNALSAVIDSDKKWVTSVKNALKKGKGVNIWQSLEAHIKSTKDGNFTASLKNIIEADGADFNFHSFSDNRYHSSKMEFYYLKNAFKNRIKEIAIVEELINKTSVAFYQTPKPSVDDLFLNLRKSVGNLHEEILAVFKEQCQDKGLFQK